MGPSVDLKILRAQAAASFSYKQRQAFAWKILLQGFALNMRKIVVLCWRVDPCTDCVKSLAAGCCECRRLQ
jgi:hypothetical protein